MKKRKIIMCEKCLCVDDIITEINWDTYSTRYRYYHRVKPNKWYCDKCFREVSYENK